MVDRGTVVIRVVNKPARDAIDGCIDRASIMAGREAEAFFWRSDGWTVVPRDKTPAPVCDGGCFFVAAVGAHHKVGSAKVDGGMAD